MNENNSNNHAPIFTFLNKHKWRIVLPMIFALFYFALPRYLTQYIAVQEELFIKSSSLNADELEAKAEKVRAIVHGDEFLQNLIIKYDLYSSERDNNIDQTKLVEKLRNAITIEPREWEVVEGIQVHIWSVFRKENAEHLQEISRDIASNFENVPEFEVTKFFTKPYDASPYRSWVLFADLAVRGLFMFSIPLILLWEIPNIFYSSKTKETVFEPIQSDWQDELNHAKLRNETWKSIEINAKYSFAFLSAMVLKSPFGDIIEYVRKIAS
jgi:hypothetical protein